MKGNRILPNAQYTQCRMKWKSSNNLPSRILRCPLILLIGWFGIPQSTVTVLASGDADETSSQLSPWQECSVFMAPTTRTKMNWGVFANRDFSPGEIVDISPLTVPIPDGSGAIERSILHDYVYAYMRLVKVPGDARDKRGRPLIDKLNSVLFGPDMIYNHHPVEPNVQFTTFGREPFDGAPNAVNPQGFVARRQIRRGEELFSSYNGDEDGGKFWFHQRGINLEVPPRDEPLTGSDLKRILFFEQTSVEFCSKIYSGPGLPTWEGRLLPLLPKNYKLPFHTDLKWLAPSDAGWGDAKTKVKVDKGDRLEVSTALILSREYTQNTALMPLVYAWKDLNEEHQNALKRLHAKNQLHLQYQGPDTSWKSINNFTNHENFEDLVLFPVAGNIGMVRRKSSSIDANCKLVIYPKPDDAKESDGQDSRRSSLRFLDNPLGVTIELIATKDMKESTTLVLELEESQASPLEYMLLYRELKLTGQPFSTEVFRDRRRRQERIRQNRESGRSTPLTTTSTEL